MTTQTTDLTDLAETLLATNKHADSWAWNAAEDGGQPDAYIDCSGRYGEPGIYCLEVGDGDDVAQVQLTLGDLKEIHRQLTLQLMVMRMRGEI